MQVVTCNMPFNEIHFGNTNSQYRQQPLQRFCEHATSKEVIMYMYEGYFVFVNRAFCKWMANFDEPGCWIGPPTVLYTMGTVPHHQHTTFWTRKDQGIRCKLLPSYANSCITPPLISNVGHVKHLYPCEPSEESKRWKSIIQTNMNAKCRHHRANKKLGKQREASPESAGNGDSSNAEPIA